MRCLQLLIPSVGSFRAVMRGWGDGVRKGDRNFLLLVLCYYVPQVGVSKAQGEREVQPYTTDSRELD